MFPAIVQHDDPVDHSPFHFDFHFQHKSRPVPAPAHPLIPDDDDATHAFSHYIAHGRQQQQPLSPSTPLSYSASSLSSGPFSAVTPSSVSSFPAFTSYNPTPQPTPAPQPAPRHAPTTAPTAPEPSSNKRPSGACTRCKKMKMKCEFRPSDPACQRCKSGRFDCVVEGRKPRTPSQREWLLAQIRQKDAMIATLLKAYRPAHTTPITLAANKLALPPAARTAHREALAWAEKGGGAAAGNAANNAQRWRVRFRERERERRKSPGDDGDDDDDWSSADSAESEDPWDADAAAAAGAAGVGAVYAHALPEPSAPLGVLARLSLEDDGEGESGGETKPAKRAAEVMEGGAAAEAAESAEDDAEWGIASRAYFQPGPSANLALRRVLNERETPPAIIASGLITWTEAEKLFQVFYDFVNPYVSVLDPVLHTCATVFERCPFLFTVVCAIALRYHTPRAAPHLHKLAMHLAKTAAATAFVDGVKSVELVQGYFLLSVYGLPARRWEEDRSWFYGGLATRIAVDLGLHKPAALTTKPLSERHARELRNRVRTWLICFNVDRSSSTQFGKPSGIHDEEVVKGGREWYGGVYHHPYDLHLVMYVELLRVMSRFHEQVYKDGILNKNCNFRAVTEATEAELRVWHDDITWRYENESDPTDPGSVFRSKGVPLFENYMRLVMYSFGFQDAWHRRNNNGDDGHHSIMNTGLFFAKCLRAASAVIRHIIDVFAPSGYLRYAPDCYFVMGGFCSAFLLKMLRAEFAELIDGTQRARIVALVASLVDVLASPAVALDEAHTPMLYARFLRGQLRAVEEDGGGGGVAAGERERAVQRVQDEREQQQQQQQQQQHLREHEQQEREQDHPPRDNTPPLFAHATPGSSSAGSSVPTPGPDTSWPDAFSEGGGSGSGSATAGPGDMALCEEEYLATMQAVAGEGWWGSVLMPGFKWDQGGVDVGGVGGGMGGGWGASSSFGEVMGMDVVGSN